MKWFVLVILLVLFTQSLYSNNTWEIVSEDTLNKDINGLFFINENTGWAVGNDGKIIKTTDSGKNWFSQLSKTTQNLNAVYFINEYTGWAVGGKNGNNGDTGNAKIIKTTDGGDTWVSKFDYEEYVFNCIYMVNDSVGYAGGGYYGNRAGTVYKTKNGGEKWGKISSNFVDSESIVNSIYFINDSTGWVVGCFEEKEWGNFSIIKKTTNGGSTWKNLFYKKMSQPLRSVYFIDDMRGWVVGDNGVILNVEDSGEIWNDTLSSPGYYDKVFFKDKLNGFIIKCNGNILRTNNGGHVWYIDTVSNSYELNNSFILNNDNIWSINKYSKGRSNYIVKYTRNNTSVNTMDFENKLIYPNPAIDYIIVPLNNFTVYNSIGILIGNYQHPKVDVSAFPKGVYFVRSGNDLMKFIK